MRPVRYLLAGLAAAAAIYSAVLGAAAAEYARNTPQSAARAVWLVPYNGDYLVRLAAWNRGRQDSLLRRALQANPFQTQAWIGLALDAEFRQNDLAAAERYYLQAEATNHMYVPKWTLTNYYFRRGNAEQFLRWATATLEITPYSAGPVFAEMWLLAPDTPRLAAAVPDNPNTLWQYAWFLNGAGQWQAIPPVIARLVRAAGRADPETFGRSSIAGPILDKLLRNGFSEQAAAVWTSLSEGGWIRLPPPSAARPVTNGDFAAPFWPHGFDWLPIDSASVSVEQHAGNREVRIEFSGDQPEHCPVLTQWIPLAPGAYHLHWSAQTERPDTAADLNWRLRGRNGEELISPAFADAGDWSFQAPAASGAYLLSLEYARRPGFTRGQGWLILKGVSAKR